MFIITIIIITMNIRMSFISMINLFIIIFIAIVGQTHHYYTILIRSLYKEAYLQRAPCKDVL